MGGEIFKQLLESLDKAADAIPDNRHGPNTKHSMRDAVKSAFGVFFFQFPLFLRYMTEMQNKRKKNNAKSVLGVKTLPSDAQVRNFLDNVNPETFASVFSQSLKVAIKCGVMKQYQVLDEGVLVAIDGLWYHSATLHFHLQTRQSSMACRNGKTLIFDRTNENRTQREEIFSLHLPLSQ
ncbi:MAG: hypothetical protein Ta2A_00480 [Treponemataceae bacterium]|nr:MAG: hypothetical protein Ta2A_00480 [Treponemataceae bacterium]